MRGWIVLIFVLFSFNLKILGEIVTLFIFSLKNVCQILEFEHNFSVILKFFKSFSLL